MEQIAVVGANVRVPGADTPEALWANLLAGRSSIAALSAQELAAAGVDAHEQLSPDYVARAGWIEGIEEFDHAFFDYSFREAQHIDPQQRILLTLSHQLLEAIGRPPRSTGVFVSVGFPSYLIRNLVPADTDTGLASIGNSSHSAATRIAYKLNLTGPAITVECGCSSSLMALHMARLAILTGQCEMALVGGCTLRIPAKQGYVHQRDGVLAQDGICRPWDERAGGTVFTSGAMVVAVKKLSAAIEDGDEVWCIVRGTAANNDGNAKAGFTAPSVDGQRELIQRVYARTQVSPRSVGYLEAHGTGTVLGDPIEFRAVAEAFASFTPDRGFCSLGSIKGNVGHLDVAAGLAGLVKAALCLSNRAMPPLANFSRINPRIDLAASPFYVQTEARPWEKVDGEPRRAAVTALGVGGTNVHALLEEAPPRRPGLSARWGLVFASAKSPAELEAKAEAIVAMARHAPEQIGDLAYTSQLSPPRHRMHAAYFLDADGRTGITSRSLQPSGDWRERGIVFAFPGQGTQYEGMGLELHEHVPAFRVAFDRAAALFRGMGAADPRALMEASAAEIGRAESLQPYLFCLEHALGSILLDAGLRPIALLGHSLGEYVAATLAGVFDLETAVRVVAERTRIMAAAPPGAMLVVQAPEEVARQYIDEDVSLCVVNGTRSSVLGGTIEAIEAIADELERAGQKVVRLNTPHAFHSHLMAAAAAQFEDALAGVTFGLPELAIISNLDGRQGDRARFAGARYWARHMREPVRFLDCLRTIAASPVPPVVLEVGPGRSVGTNLLSSFPQGEVAVLSSLGPAHEREHLFGMLGQLTLNGVGVDLRTLDGERRGRIVPLPASPLAPQRCWVEPSRGATHATARTAAAPRKQENVSNWLYEQRWSPRIHVDDGPARHDGPSEITVFSTWGRAGETLSQAVGLAGATARLIAIDDLFAAEAPRELELLHRTIAQRLHGREIRRATVLFDGGASSPRSEPIQSLLIASAIAKAVRRAAGKAGELVLIGLHGVRTTTEPLRWWNAWMAGFATVASQELNGLSVRYVDIDEQTQAGDAKAFKLLARIVLNGEERVSAIRGGLVWERDPRAVRAGSGRTAASPLRRVLIVGGTGNVGSTYALHFLRAGASGITLVSRNAESVAPRLAAGDVPERQIWARFRRLADEAKRAGADLQFLNADAGVPVTLERAAEHAARRYGGLDAIVHASGAPADLHFRPFFATDRAQLETLFRAKLDVAGALDGVARRLHVPRILAVSSISGLLGGFGLLGYATSHNLLDAYAAASSGAECRWATIAWDAWDFYKEDRGAEARDVGIDTLAISEQEGIEALGAVAGAAWPGHVIVSSGDLHRRHAAWVLRTETQTRQSDIERGERPSLREEYVAPKGDIDCRLAELVGEAVGLKAVGVRDNFFELGGDSMIALNLVQHINQAFGSDVSVIDIFKFPTVEKLAACLAGAAAAAGPAAAASEIPTPDASPAEGARQTGRRGYFEAVRNRRELTA